MLKSLSRNVRYLEALVAKVIDENANLQTAVRIKLEHRALNLWPLVEALIHDLHPVAGTDSTRLSNMGVECWITDNVEGIPQELLEQVFDKRETDFEKAGRTGLGLAIVKSFIEAHDGKVSVESTKGSGSTLRHSG